MSFIDDQDAARKARARDVALFRCRLIAPALEPGVTSRQRGRLVRGIAARVHTGPSGGPARVSRKSLDRWIRAWRAGGFEALCPSPRQVTPRTEAAVLELAAALKKENPDRTAAQVTRILRAHRGWAPSERTLQRHFARAEIAAGPRGVAHGRFEAEAPNLLWTGDVLHGPAVTGRKTYLFAFIDDHSRLITGFRWGFSEDSLHLAEALKRAIAIRGVPARLYVGNGACFSDETLPRYCAKLGITLVHSPPCRPQGRGKIERWFETVRAQFLAGISPRRPARPRPPRGRRPGRAQRPVPHPGRARLSPAAALGDRRHAAGPVGQLPAPARERARAGRRVLAGSDPVGARRHRHHPVPRQHL